MFLPLAELREGRGLSRTTVATQWVAGRLAIRAALRRAAEWTIVHRRALAGLSAPLPAVSRAAIRLVVFRVVTEAAGAGDKSEANLAQEEDHPIFFLGLFTVHIIFGCKRRNQGTKQTTRGREFSSMLSFDYQIYN